MCLYLSACMYARMCKHVYVYVCVCVCISMCVHIWNTREREREREKERERERERERRRKKRARTCQRASCLLHFNQCFSQAKPPLHESICEPAVPRCKGWNALRSVVPAAGCQPEAAVRTPCRLGSLLAYADGCPKSLLARS